MEKDMAWIVTPGGKAGGVYYPFETIREFALEPMARHDDMFTTLWGNADLHQKTKIAQYLAKNGHIHEDRWAPLNSFFRQYPGTAPVRDHFMPEPLPPYHVDPF
jgi:hypothetical protein